MASYTCERGFELLGPARRVCDQGTWAPEGIPFCGKFVFRICITSLLLIDCDLGVFMLLLLLNKRNAAPSDNDGGVIYFLRIYYYWGLCLVREVLVYVQSNRSTITNLRQ